MRYFTQDPTFCAGVVNKLSSWPLSNGSLQGTKEQRLRHFLTSNIQHLTPSDKGNTHTLNNYISNSMYFNFTIVY